MGALGQAYSSNGLSYRTSPGGDDLQSGEVFFASPPAPSDLAAAFPGYTAAVAARQVLAAANAQLATAMAAGLTVTWTASTLLNATYALDQTTQFNVTAETVSILVNGTFTNGQSTRNWPTIVTGSFVTMAVAQFKSLATATALYIDQCQTAYATAAAGGQATWPSANITISG